MASNRHLGRIIALQTLYEQDFRCEAGDNNFTVAEVLSRNIERYREMVEDKAFIEALTLGVTKCATDLDTQLQPIAPEWPISQIARMDRVILRMGLYELLYQQDVPPKVVINEAVELAKAFGGDNSSKFINGVLGTVMRQLETVGTDGNTKTHAVTSAANNSHIDIARHDAVVKTSAGKKDIQPTDPVSGEGSSSCNPMSDKPKPIKLNKAPYDEQSEAASQTAAITISTTTTVTNKPLRRTKKVQE